MLSPSRQHMLGFALALALVALIGIQMRRVQDALLQANASVTRSLQLITVIQGTLSALQDVETGMRGYVITGDAPFLGPYHAGRADVALRLRELHALLGTVRDRSDRLHVLDAAVERRLELAAANVDARRVEGAAAAAERVRTAGGREAMDRVRALLGELEARERDRLADEHRQVERLVERSRLFTIVGGLGALALLLAALASVDRSLRVRRRLAAEAQAAAARQAALLRAIPDTLWELGPDGHTQGLSAGAPSTPHAALQARLRGQPVGDDGATAPFDWAADDGTEYEVRSVDAGGGRLVIVRDITEASRNRRAVRDQREFLRTIVDTDENLIAVRDAAGRFSLCNVAFCDVVGLDPSQVEGHAPEAIAGHEGLAPLLDGDAAVADGADEWRAAQVHLVDAAGADRWLQVLKRALVLADGTRHVLTVAVDITARLRAERLKDEFISTVSHELRTPLTSIRGALGMVVGGLAGEVPEGARPLLDIAQKNTERLVRLINDILDIEKLESGRLKLQLRTSGLRTLAQQAVEQIGPYADGFGVAVVLAPGEDGEAEVDPDRFGQVMANLLSNAIKHSPPGGRVDVGLARVDDGLRLTVADAGEGIPEAFRPHVFERFAQADASDVRRRGGTGLGLAITRSLVEQMRGRISFETATGAGTRFAVWLPAAAPTAAPRPTAGDAPRIVLLAAEPAVAAELVRLLAMQGVICDLATDPAQARARLATPGVRGLAIDLALPGGAAPAFLREVRLQPRYRHLPVLLLGVEAAPELRGGAVGVVDWLDKPLDPGQVAAAIRGCLQGRRERPQVLHVEDDPDVRDVLRGLLASAPLDLHAAATLAEARIELARRRHDLVVLDLMLPDGDGAELLPELGEARPPVPVVIFSAQDRVLPESRGVLQRLVKSRSDAAALASLIAENLRHWPATAASEETP
ncbi:CHASE3 domain-containing protein [Lysobacter humi (ex Lee et al. 2017)]